MSSKVTKKSNNDSEYTKCPNCRQDILKDKMFLHEGFCSRNNVFCDHCEKVFLKKDYEEHVKKISKLPKNKGALSPVSQNSKETQPETLKQNSYIEENENSNNNTIPIVPKPSLEILQMPVTELYKINEPIFVNETGQIISNKNNNGYVLPYFGVNFRSSKINEKILDDIIEQGDIFKENNTISQNCYDIQGLSNLLNKKHNNYLTINSSPDSNDKDFSIGLSNIRLNDSIKSFKNNTLTNNSISPESKTIEINPIDSFKIENKENISQSRRDKDEKFKTIYIKNSVANHSQTKFKKKYNFFSFQQTPNKSPENSKHTHNTVKKSVKNPIPLDKASRNTPKRKEQFLENNIENNKYQDFKKEPKDSNSKRKSIKINYKFSRFSGAKNKDPLYLSERREKKDNFEPTKRDHCLNKNYSNKYNTHIEKKLKKKIANKKLSIPRPKKLPKKNNIEEFCLEDDEEICIDDKKKETLTRQLNPSSLNVFSVNFDNINQTFITNPERTIYASQMIQEHKKMSLKKNLFHFQNNERNDAPKDNKRNEMDKMDNNKLRKKLYNLSQVINNNDDFNDRCNWNKSLVPKKTINHLKTGEIVPFVFFNNEEKIIKYPKDKKLHKNTII